MWVGVGVFGGVGVYWPFTHPLIVVCPCASQGMLKRDAQLPGYAIGGLAGGEEKSLFWPVVDKCCAGLPDNKPRYLMGVG